MEEENVGLPQPIEESVQENVDVQSSEQMVNTTPEQPRIKVKHLHEEKELSYDEAVPYVQKGLDYDRVRDKYESAKPVLSFVEKLAKDNGMSVEQYLVAVEEYQQQEQIRTIAEREGVSEEFAARLYNLESKEKAREVENQTYAQQQQKNKEYQEFFDYYAKENERSFDPAVDKIPDEVWQLVNSGKTLTDAYQIHERSILKSKMKEYESKLQTQQTNAKNAETSTGSVTGNGNAGNDFLTPEMIDSMTDKERMSRWPEIKKVLGMK